MVPTGASTLLTGSPSSSAGSSRPRRRSSRRSIRCWRRAKPRTSWELWLPSRGRTCRPSEGAHQHPLLSTAPLPHDTILVMRRRQQGKTASAEARARVAVFPRQWCPVHGTAMVTAWSASVESASQHSAAQTALASNVAAGVRMVRVSLRKSSASGTLWYTSESARRTMSTPTGPQATSTR